MYKLNCKRRNSVSPLSQLCGQPARTRLTAVAGTLTLSAGTLMAYIQYSVPPSAGPLLPLQIGLLGVATGKTRVDVHAPLLTQDVPRER